MSIISIGIPIPDRSALPGQTGGEVVEVNLQYATQNYCKLGGTTVLPTVATPSGGVFSSSDNVSLPVVPSTGLFNVGVSDPGNYTITYTVAGVGSANFPINIGAVIDTTITGDSATCIGSAPSPTDLTAVPGYSNYEWFKDNVSVQNGASNTYTPAFNVAGSFVYKVTITDNSLSTPCEATSSNFTFTVNSLPTITISNATGGFCSGSSTTITTTVSAGTIFAWYKDDVLIVGQTGSSLVVTEAGEYKATVTDANGCTSALSNGLDIEEFDSPSVTITTVPGTTICTGDTATLTANPTGGSGSGYTYLWSNSDTSQAISVAPTTTTTYSVTVTDSNGCTATASQEITPSTNATTIASINNDAAMSFNGTDQYISAGNDTSLQITGNITLSAWINTTQTTNGWIIAKDDASNRNYAILVANVSGIMRARFYIVKSGTVTPVTSTTINVGDGDWHHVVGVNDGTDIKIYVDGNLEDTNSGGGGTIDNDTVNLEIGRRGDNQFFFNGSIDEVAIFNTALSSCDIKGIYEATTTVNGQPKSANLLDANTIIPAPIYWNRMGDS